MSHQPSILSIQKKKKPFIFYQSKYCVSLNGLHDRARPTENSDKHKGQAHNQSQLIKVTLGSFNTGPRERESTRAAGEEGAAKRTAETAPKGAIVIEIPLGAKI